MELLEIILQNLTTLLVFVLTLLIVILYKNTRRGAGVPPGPYRLPVVGNLGSLIGKDTLSILANLRTKYGDIYGIYIGSELKIFLNGYDLIHEALVKRGTLFSRRPLDKYRKEEFVGVVFGDGAWHKERRAFILNTFRDLCFRKTGFTLEDRITDEIACFTDKLSTLTNEDVDISQLVTYSFANVINSILHGRRVGYDDAKFKWYQDLLDKAFRDHVNTQTIRACCPYLRYLPGNLLHVRRTANVVKELINYFNEICQENFEKYRPGDDNCFIDYWLAAGETDPRFRKEHLWIVLHDLMAAGSETTATTLKWIILALASYPEMQKKLQKKVDEVIKKDTVPSITDKANMPYVEATILEALRIGSAVPLSVPHAVLHDTEFHGFKLSRNDTILPNITSVHFDPNIFPDPDTFKPERFLNDDETTIVGTEKLIPFSLGPRSCIGETLARMELFLYVATLVQTLEFLAPDNSVLPPLKGVFGLTHRPENFKVKIRTRS